MKENNKKYTQELNKRTEDLNFYKLSCEELKKKTNKEHEAISSCLYELAGQFKYLKNAVVKEEPSSKKKKKMDNLKHNN